jgi:hypothetical protein
MRYSVRLFDEQGQLIAALTKLADLQLTRLLNDAWELSFAVTPAQHGADELAMGAVCVLYEGGEPIVRAHITERDFTERPWRFRAESSAVLLKRLQTPGAWDYQGWSPEAAIADLVDGYRWANQGSTADWAGGELHQVAPLTLGDGDEVLLLERQPNGSYHTEGYAILPVVDLGPDCTDITRLRWAQSIGRGQRLTVQVRMGNTAAPGAGWTDWSAAFERVDSEAGAAIAGQGYRYAQVRADFYTDDTMAPNPDGEPQGYSPVLYATEMVGRYAGPIGAGSLPTNSGLVLDETMVFDHTDHLAAIARICDAVGWQWYVDASDKLHAGPALGADLSSEAIYREGRNCRVTAFREDKANVRNIVLGLGAGRGVGQLQVEYRHEESIAKYGECRGRYVNTAQTSKTALLSEVQAYADEHAEPIVQVSLEAGVPPRDWPLFQVGDAVRFVSERRGVNVVLPIAEEQRTLEGVTLGLNTSLNAMRDLLIGLQRPRPGTGEALPPAAPVDISATPGPERIYLRWTGRAERWRIETRATEQGAWQLLEAEWRSLSYAHTGLTPGQRHWYRVTAVRSALESAPSATVSAEAGYLEPGHIPDYSLGVSKFLQDISPPRLVSSLPGLPHPDYAEGAIVYLTTDGQLYTSDGAEWVPVGAEAVTAARIMAGIIEAGGITAQHISATEGLNISDRVVVGNLGGRQWGFGTLPEGTYGIWGDNAGLYLRGYANTLLVGYAQDEELIDLSAYNPANPQIMVAPKSVLTYSPQQKDAIPVIFTDAVQEEDGKFRIKAKTLIRGAYSSWPVGWTEGNDRQGAWQQPQTAAPNGNKGVDTNYIRCRVYWYASGTYVIGVYQYVTNEFDANGQPVNWQRKRSFTHQGPLFGSHSGTLDWDLALPQGQWAIRVSWDGGNPPAATYASAEVTGAGYRSDVYLGMDGSAIAPDAPSGMDVMYYAFDRG